MEKFINSRCIKCFNFHFLLCDIWSNWTSNKDQRDICIVTCQQCMLENIHRYAREYTHYLLYINDLMKIKLFEMPKEAESSNSPPLEMLC